MKFIKRNILLILILLIAFVLRFNIDLFIPGFCFDEIAIVSVAKQSFPFEILKELSKLDYHAPLYYLICHFFIYFDSNGLYLRFFNLLISLFNIIVFYLIGKELKNKETGLILALFFAINHLLVSTVSFVKFYCLCIFLVSLSILFLIKCLKGKKYLNVLSLINALYIFSATLGFIFIFFEYVVLYFSKQNTKKEVVKSFLFSFLGFILYLPVLFIQTKTALLNIMSPHGAYSGLNFVSVYGFINDYLTPLLNHVCNYETVGSEGYILTLIDSIYKSHFDFFVFFILLIFSFNLIIINFITSYFAIKNNKTAKKLSLVFIFFTFTMFLLVKAEIVGFVGIYFYPAGILLLIISALGFSYLRKKIKILFLIYIVTTQLIITNTYPINKRDNDKDKIYYCLEKYFKNNKEQNAIYIMTTGGRFLEKYYKDKNIFNFDFEQVSALNGRKYFNLIYKGSEKINKTNVRDFVKPIILNNKTNEDFENYIKKELISKLKPDEKIVYVFNCDCAPFLLSEKEIKTILTTKNYTFNLANPLRKIPSKIKEDEYADLNDLSETINTYSNIKLIEVLEKYLKREKIEQYVKTKDFDYVKTFESDKMPQSTVWIGQHAENGWIFITYTCQ